MVDLPWGGGRDEELGAVGILPCIGHAKETSLGVLQLEVLVRELGTIDCNWLSDEVYRVN